MVDMKSAATIGILLLGVVMTAPAAAQPYEARQSGDIVQLEDTASRTVVSIITSVGNMAYEMRVNGHNILRFPFASIDAYRARPARVGIPLLAPWGNRLDEQAFYANGKRYAFDMAARQHHGRDPDSRLHEPDRPVAGRRIEARRHGGVAHEPARRLQAAGVDEAVAVRPHDRDDLPPAGGRARGAHEGGQSLGRADAGGPRLPSMAAADRLAARGVDRHGAGAHEVAAVAPESADGRDGADRHVLPGLQGRAQGLQHRRCVHGPRAGRAGPGDDDGEGPLAADRADAGPELQGAHRLLAEPAEHGPRQPDSAAGSERAARRNGVSPGRTRRRHRPRRRTRWRRPTSSASSRWRASPTRSIWPTGVSTRSCSPSRPAARGRRVSGSRRGGSEDWGSRLRPSGASARQAGFGTRDSRRKEGLRCECSPHAS